jgi:peptide/nickel transport system permease protein
LRLRTFIIRRLLLLIPVLIGVSLLVFSLTRIAGNPAAAYITDRMSDQQIQIIKEQFHLNAPIHEQYYYWLDGVLHGNWGYSKVDGVPVTTAIATHFPATFELTLVSMVIAVIVGITMGTFSAVRRDTVVDHATRIVALSGVALPIFVLGLILQYIFAYQLGWLPIQYDRDIQSLYLFNSPAWILPNGTSSPTGFLLFDTIIHGDWPRFIDAFQHIILPAFTLSFSSIAIITRIMRGSMLEVMNLDYVKTARSKGLPEKVVIKKHARRNALIPTTTVVGLSFGGLLGGAVLTESIFSWPGLGRWSAQSTLTNDWASILGFTLLTAIIYVLANLIVDVMYAHLDPRVRLE